ncbi:rhodanese-like domain-containing protein [Echinicola shivajiensis]|uniref:rhodanese-like domain-containing protein n=1 Tax=Echinicola shivajiensis TaxID=1035916 RepID=UPI001BFC8CE8|nr:rhodanese-like domain-containing protein [Echinicola shivajiensis]
MIDYNRHLTSKKKKTVLLYIPLIFLIVLVTLAFQQKEPWTAKQMMPPAELAKKLQLPDSRQPLIISIGPQAVIKNSVDIGPGENPKNISKLKALVNKLPKDSEIVLYCGCCPLTKCPNVRPAFSTLNEMGFKNHKLLALLTNIKVDWMDKDYPIKE